MVDVPSKDSRFLITRARNALGKTWLDVWAQRQRVLWFGIVAILTLVLGHFGWFQSFEFLAYDQGVRWLPTHAGSNHPQVVLVLADDHDSAQWQRDRGRGATMPDDELVGTIAKLESMGALAIGVDLYRNDLETTALTSSPAKQPQTPLAMAFEEHANSNEAEPDWSNVVFGWSVATDENRKRPESLPPAFMLDDLTRFGGQIGFNDIVLSSDGIVRKWCLLMTSAGQAKAISEYKPFITSMDLQLVWKAAQRVGSSSNHLAVGFDRGNLVLGGKAWPSVREDLHPVNGPAPYQIAADFKSFEGKTPLIITLDDLNRKDFANSPTSRNIRGNVILLASAAKGAADEGQRTPLGEETRLSGDKEYREDCVILHARCIDQLLLAAQGHLAPLSTPGRNGTVAWNLFWPFLVAVVFAFTAQRPWRRTACILVAVVAILVIFFWSLRWQSLLPIAQPLTALFFLWAGLEVGPRMFKHLTTTGPSLVHWPALATDTVGDTKQSDAGAVGVTNKLENINDSQTLPEENEQNSSLGEGSCERSSPIVEGNTGVESVSLRASSAMGRQQGTAEVRGTLTPGDEPKVASARDNDENEPVRNPETIEAEDGYWNIEVSYVCEVLGEHHLTQFLDLWSGRAIEPASPKFRDRVIYTHRADSTIQALFKADVTHRRITIRTRGGPRSGKSQEHLRDEILTCIGRVIERDGLPRRPLNRPIIRKLSPMQDRCWNLFRLAEENFEVFRLAETWDAKFHIIQEILPDSAKNLPPSSETFRRHCQDAGIHLR